MLLRKLRSRGSSFTTSSDAGDAHKALEARATFGTTVLIIEPTVQRSFS